MPVQQTISINNPAGVTVTGATVEIIDPVEGTTTLTGPPQLTVDASNVVINTAAGVNVPLDGTIQMQYDHLGQSCTGDQVSFVPFFVPGVEDYNFSFVAANTSDWDFEDQPKADFTTNFNLPVAPVNPSDLNLLDTGGFIYYDAGTPNDNFTQPSNRLVIGIDHSRIASGVSGYSTLPFQAFGCNERGNFSSNTQHASTADFGTPEVIQYVQLTQNYNPYGPVTNISELLIEGSNDNVTWTTLFDNGATTYTNAAAASSSFGFRFWTGFNENRTAYRYYRTRTTTGGGSRITYPCISWGVGYLGIQNDARATNNWYHVKSTASTQIDATGFNNMDIAPSNEVLPANTDIRYLISVDGRNNWGVFTDASTFSTVVSDAGLEAYDWSTSSMTKTNLEAFTFDISTYTTLDFAIALFSSSSVNTPTLDGLGVTISS